MPSSFIVLLLYCDEDLLTNIKLNPTTIDTTNDTVKMVPKFLLLLALVEWCRCDALDDDDDESDKGRMSHDRCSSRLCAIGRTMIPIETA
jgi:hypothetical protein